MLARLRSLLHVSDYRQPAGRHPTPNLAMPGQERIELVTDGRGWVQHEGAWHAVGPGDLLWECAGDWTIGRSDFAAPYRCLSVTVAVDPDGARPAPHRSRWHDLDAARAFAADAVRQALGDGEDRDALAAWIYGRLLFQARSPAALAQRVLPAPLRRALDLLDARFADPLPIESLARAAGWTPNHLHAAFRQNLDTTPHRYLIERRLRAARELLVATREPIAAVAMACGFADAAALCRCFARMIGCAPGAYRRRAVEPSLRRGDRPA